MGGQQCERDGLDLPVAFSSRQLETTKGRDVPARYKHVQKATRSHVLEYYTWELARARGRGRHMLWDTEGEQAGSLRRHAPGPDEIQNHGGVHRQIPLEFEGRSIKNRRGGLGRRDSGLRRGSGSGGGRRKQPTGDDGHALGHPLSETLLTRRYVLLEFSNRGCNVVELHLEVRRGSTNGVSYDENNKTRSTA